MTTIADVPHVKSGILLCPYCSRQNDSITHFDQGELRATQPSPGEFSFCIRCRTAGRFELRDGVLEVVRLVPGDLADLLEALEGAGIARQEVTWREFKEPAGAWLEARLRFAVAVGRA